MDIERYLQYGNVKSPIYSPLGNKLCFICDHTGVSQIWELDLSKRGQARSFFTKEGITFIDYINGTENLIIGMDPTGSEMEQLYLLNAEEQLIPLTNSPKHLHQYGGCSSDGEWIAWASNRRHPAYLDLYIQNLKTLAIHLVYSGNGHFSALKWSPDGTSLLVRKTSTPLDNDLGILDLATGKMNWLTEHQGEASFKNAFFSWDGAYLYLLTNKDREFFGLGFIEIATKKMTWLKRGTWDFEHLTMNEDKNMLAFTMNQGGISKGFVFDLIQGALFTWETPMGVISQLLFSPDNKKLTYDFSGPTHPPDLWELELKTLQPYRLTYFSQPSLRRHEFIEPIQISYPSFDQLKVPAFFYKPITADRKPPVILFLHGGPESQIRANYSPVIQYFLRQGFAVCAPNFRGSTGYGKFYTHLDDARKRMDAVKDLVYLVKWLRNYGGIDPKKVALIGVSYGGFMTLAASCHYPAYWSAAITIAGFPSIKTFLQTTNPLRRKIREAEYGSIERDGEFFDQIDPLHHTGRMTAPLMLIHGANDSRVSIHEIERMKNLLTERKHPVRFIRFEDEGHEFSKRKNKLFAYKEIVRFLKWSF